MRFRLKSGLALGYKTRGMGPLVVMVPPIGCPKEFYDPLIARLEHRCRVIAVEIRGHGESDVPPGPFTLDDCAGDVIELVRAVGNGQKIVVGGCSMGAMVAMGTAVLAPDLVSGLLISNTHQRDANGRALIGSRADAALPGMPNALATTLERWFNPAYRTAHPEHVALARDWLANADPVVHAWSWRAIQGLDYADRLKALRCPVMVVAGEADQSSSVTEVRHFAEEIGAHYRLVPGAGHCTPLENPQAYAAHICEFLDGLQPLGR